jgi:hypothetical protein
LTLSKRRIHDRFGALEGTRKSLRYQPTEPFMEAMLLSPAVQSCGTDTWVQPIVEERRKNSRPTPSSFGSAR